VFFKTVQNEVSKQAALLEFLLLSGHLPIESRLTTGDLTDRYGELDGTRCLERVDEYVFTE